ncbi:unnamed protein product [Cuscuta epithymum]|uniref:Retrotransposon gag domain-containing protein n=1 Tax=Cuscuta epithymum TaxID=186058 RepID=A0AAV0E2G2_9ASTE|nr:unnamed protein product [Cuscuta epithymum]
MEGTNQLLIEFHQQLETVREEIRREMAERMALLQRENDVLRSQVQSAVSIASNSRPNRRSDLMNAATRLDLSVSPPSTTPPAASTDPVSLTLGLSPTPTGEPYSAVISQVIPYTPLVPATTPLANIPVCFFTESLRVRPNGLGLHAETQSIPMTTPYNTPTEPSIPQYRSRTSGDPGPSNSNPSTGVSSAPVGPSIPNYGDRGGGEATPSNFMQDARRSGHSVSFLEPHTQRLSIFDTSSTSTFSERRPEVIQVAGPTSSSPGPLHSDMEDQMSMFMEQMRQMQDKINGLPGVPPHLDRASRTCYAESPFSRHVTNVEIPRKFVAPAMKMFDGTSDPVEHVAQFKQRMLAVALTPDQREACMCRGFGTTLSGPALTWFVNLPNEGIDSFAELVDSFTQQFASSRTLEKQTSDLYRIIQQRDESLRDYFHRFNREKVSISRCDIPTTIEAFRRGLKNDSELYRELTKFLCRTFEDVQAITLAFIRLEEDLRAQPHADSYEGGHRKSSTSRRHDYRTGKPYAKAEERPVTAATHWLDDPDLPPVILDYCFNVSTLGLINSLEKLGEKVRWPKRTDKPVGKRDPSKHCDFDNDIGHNTEDCVTLRKEVAYLLTEIVSERTKALLGRTDKSSTKATRPPSPSAPCQVINFINGGSDLCGLTYSAAKRHAREYSRDKSLQVCQVERRRDDWRNTDIAFDESDMSDPMQPHHDTLVISLRVANFEVKRVLVDNGSTTNITTMWMLEQMGIKEDDITKSGSTLVGFNGEPSRTIGNISLPVYANGVNVQVKFDVVQDLPAYNMISGTPWLHQMGAIPSTYHQVIKFPTPWGVESIRGDLVVAKSCYQTAMKPTANPPTSA